MKSLDSTQLLPQPTWTDPRVHLLDDLWLLAIFAILFAAGLPWLVSSFDIQLGPALLALLGLAAIHVGFTLLTAPAPGINAGRKLALMVLHAVGVVVIAVMWHYAGGIHNPAFLLVFALPVVGAIFLSRWQPYAVALLAILAVAAVALIQLAGAALVCERTRAAGSMAHSPFGRHERRDRSLSLDFMPLPGDFLVMLEVFAVLMVACGLRCRIPRHRLRPPPHGPCRGSVRGRDGDGSCGQTSSRSLPLPAMLVDCRTLQVVSESVELTTLSVEGAPAAGRKLTEAVHFTYPELIEELVNGVGGTGATRRDSARE